MIGDSGFGRPAVESYGTRRQRKVLLAGSALILIASVLAVLGRRGVGPHPQSLPTYGTGGVEASPGELGPAEELLSSPGASPGTLTSPGRPGGGATRAGSGGSGSPWQPPGGKTYPVANLFTPAEDRIGITDTQITLCGHAALTLGAVFNNNEEDFGVYWRMLNDSGGIYGRKVVFDWQDDQYTGNGAVQAAAACKEQNPFFLVGGIGFDQVPNVRNWAEQNRMLYLYSMATEEGALDKKFSWSGSPSIETVGRVLAQLTLRDYPGKKVGVAYVDSENWRGANRAFVVELARHGVDPKSIPQVAIANNNDVLTDKVLAMKNSKAEVVFLNMNALAMGRWILESDSQQYYPVYMGYGFNLTTETFGSTMKKFPPARAVWVTPAYDPQDTSTPWYPEIKRMQEAFRKYRPNKTPNDIDWIVWLAMKSFHRLLLDCGPDCTRNKLAGMFLGGYAVTEPPLCRVDYSRGRIAGYLLNVYTATPRGDTVYWRQTSTCTPGF